MYSNVFLKIGEILLIMMLNKGNSTLLYRLCYSKVFLKIVKNKVLVFLKYINSKYPYYAT